jgi:epoxyqueuosine reductase
MHAPALTPEQASALVAARARELGFSNVGFAAADRPLDVAFDRYREALGRGLHGPLGYLAENVEVRRRLDTPDILADAKSVIVVAASHERATVDAGDALSGSIARYARGRDYHNYLRKKLRSLARFVRSLATLHGAPVAARPMSDTAPVLERAWAARAGVGFVGKNGLVITPGQGSFFLLGEVVTTLELAASEPIEERCGSCRRCLDACPTDAFVEPFVLDAGKCISTWTIEARALAPEPLREAISTRLFGCDRCQDVCPFNAKERDGAALDDRHRPHERWSRIGLTDLARLGAPGGPTLDEVLIGTPLARAGANGLARNACLMLSKRGDASSRAVLREVASAHPDPVVREAAAWSLARRRDGGETLER